jgi:hypothetical protein
MSSSGPADLVVVVFPGNVGAEDSLRDVADAVRSRDSPRSNHGRDVLTRPQPGDGSVNDRAGSQPVKSDRSIP